MAKSNLVIQTAFVGDLLLTIPLLKHIKRIDPDHKLVLLCRTGLGEFFIKQSLVDEVVEFKKTDSETFKKAKQNLKIREFDKIVSPHQSFRTAILVAGLKAKHKIGYQKFWNFFAFNYRVNRPMHLPEALRQLELIRHLDLGLDQSLRTLEEKFHQRSKKYSDLIFASHESIPDWAELKIADNSQVPGNKIFLAPGSEWNTKRWIIDEYTKVAKYFIDKNFDVTVVGTSGERVLGDIIAKEVPKVKNICGETTLPQLYNEFQSGRLLISNDSGAMHMAAVAGISVVAIFGPTVQEFGYRPWTSKAKVLEADLSCRPCGLHGSQKCPIGTHDCMKLISASQVIRAAETFLC